MLSDHTPSYPSRASAFGPRGLRTARALILLILLASLAVFLFGTRRWPLVNDPAQIDYACYLVDHGLSPYRDLVEMNMPGIYLVNGSVMHTLGTGAAAWRAFDLLMMALAGAAMIVIAWPYDWLAGVFAATLFALFHGRDGPAQAGQRDFIIAALLLCACAFLMRAVRRERAALLFGFGVCAAAAGTIKPPALPFALLLLLLVCLRLRQTHKPLLRAVLWSIAGMAVPLALVFGFLARHGSLTAFVDVMRTMLPFYARIGRFPLSFLLRTELTPSLLTLLLLGALATVGRRTAAANVNPWGWEQGLLLCGIGFGAVSYVAQGKAFPYHRYPTIAFLLLWAAIQFSTGLRRAGIARIAAIAGLVFGTVVAPLYTGRAVRRAWDSTYINALNADLTTIQGENPSGQGLSGHIQCIATAADCTTVLLRRGLLQSTGLFYDYFVFTPGRDPVVLATQRRILPQLLAQPPQVIVVDRGLFPTYERDYSKLQQWPEFNRLLATRYSIAAERVFPDAEAGPRAYRLYVLKR